MQEFQLLEVANTFNDEPFSTYDFILGIQNMFPEEWESLEEKYGAGGKGAGTHYSAYSRSSQYLNKLSNHEQLYKLNYRKSPEGWGSYVIRYWCTQDIVDEANFYPDEINEDDTVTEGAKKTVTVNKYERDLGARNKCIEKYGVTCFACGFDFEEVYGERGAGFIHVHHIKPLGEIGSEYSLNPTKDLVPLCPNCHAIVHRKTPALSIKELKRLFS
ncbi:MAG: 5-methylcytosine-specific restriction enzyme A [Desulfobacteraceae bacterium Eth-SRB2]|nr:MAG: 5-methylcytosine-specific restriction enzyme A [Desulfobacteraceae bacterium Eth-SRB2]